MEITQSCYHHIHRRTYGNQTKEFYGDILKDIRKRFDTSDYPKKRESGIKTGINYKVIGLFKDEACGKQMNSFCWIAGETLLILKKERKKMQRNEKNVIRKEITFKDCKNCLFS